MGFGPTFRFGNPFFLQPNVDELIWRTQFKDNFSIVTRHAHDQGRRRVDAHAATTRCSAASSPAATSSTASPASCATPRRRRRAASARHGRLLERRVRDRCPRPCPAGTTTTGGPLLFYLQGAGRTAWRPTPPARRRSPTRSSRSSCRTSGRSRPNLTLNYGLRWDAQLMPETVDPHDDGVSRAFLNDPRSRPTARFPISGSMFQPRVGVAWDVKGDGKSVLRASAGIYYARQNMLSQVGSVTTNGLQQQTIFANTANMLGVRRADADLAGRADADAAAGRAVPALQRRPRVRSRLQEPAHLRVQRRLRAASSRRTGRPTSTSPGRRART